MQADAIEQTLIDSGLSAHLAGAIVTETVGHLLPFDTPRELRKLVRGELARRIPVQSTWAGVGRRIGFVGTGGAGKTLCAARLACSRGKRDRCCDSYASTTAEHASRGSSVSKIRSRSPGEIFRSPSTRD